MANRSTRRKLHHQCLDFQRSSTSLPAEESSEGLRDDSAHGGQDPADAAMTFWLSQPLSETLSNRVKDVGILCHDMKQDLVCRAPPLTQVIENDLVELLKLFLGESFTLKLGPEHFIELVNHVLVIFVVVDLCSLEDSRVQLLNENPDKHFVSVCLCH